MGRRCYGKEKKKNNYSDQFHNLYHEPRTHNSPNEKLTTNLHFGYAVVDRISFNSLEAGAVDHFGLQYGLIDCLDSISENGDKFVFFVKFEHFAPNRIHRGKEIPHF